MEKDRDDGGPLRIMPLGDSITTCCHYCSVLPAVLTPSFRHCTEPPTSYSGYVRRLWHRLHNHCTVGGALRSGHCQFRYVGRRTECILNRSKTLRVPRDWDVHMEGYYGYTTQRLLEEVVRPAMAAGRPHVVLLHIGTNDLIQAPTAAGAPKGRRSTAAAQHVREILHVITNPPSKCHRSLLQAEDSACWEPPVAVLLAKIIPIDFARINAVARWAGGTRRLRSFYWKHQHFNDLLTQIASEWNATTKSPTRLILVDPTVSFNMTADLHGDGLHPNSLGEAKIASAFFGPLIRLLQQDRAALEFVAEPKQTNMKPSPDTAAEQEDQANGSTTIEGALLLAFCFAILLFLIVRRFCRHRK